VGYLSGEADEVPRLYGDVCALPLEVIGFLVWMRLNWQEPVDVSIKPCSCSVF
jgi:hypothetical protein